MNISILTVFQPFYDSFLETSLVGQARSKGLVAIDVVSFRSFAVPKERIDAPSFGSGAGMLIKPAIVEKAVDSQEQKNGRAVKILFSPQGEKLTQRLLQDIYARVTAENDKQHLMLIPARYEGMDARVEEEYADYVVSVGDFVLMGGDLPTMIFLEGFLRLIPGVVGKAESVEHESFVGPFVDYPSYTQPVVWHNKEVPAVVRSGNHGVVDAWRREQAVIKTVKNHFSWLRSWPLNQKEKDEVIKHIPSHYVVLMHSHVLLGDNHEEGVSSVTSIDIHDIARSSRTYGIKNFFIVTPLKDQQQIVGRLLEFWTQGYGVEYNKNRCQALRRVVICEKMEEVLEYIKKQDGQEPIVMATSARGVDHDHKITYFDQTKVWNNKKSVVLVFGTGKGLSASFISKTDYLLAPVEGFTDFNHLSVRSAVAIVLDRWLGINEKSL